MKSIYVFIFSLLLTGLMPETAKAEESHTLYLFLHVTGQKIQVTNSVLKPMPFYGSTASPGPYRYTLLDQNSKTLYAGSFHDPLARLDDDFTDPVNPKGGKKQLTENDATLAVPALPDAVCIRFAREDETTGKSTALGEERLPVPAAP